MTNRSVIDFIYLAQSTTLRLDGKLVVCWQSMQCQELERIIEAETFVRREGINMFTTDALNDELTVGVVSSPSFIVTLIAQKSHNAGSSIP